MSRTEIPLVVLDDVTGDFVQGASCTFYDRSGTPISVYASETGNTIKTQPILTDSLGRLSNCWVDRQAYKAQIAITGHPTRTEYIDSAPGGNGAIDTAWLADGAVTSAKIADGTIQTADIADDAITSAKIAADAVGSSEIAAGAVGSSELANNAVTTPAILDGSVTEAKLAPNLVLGNRTMLRANVPRFYLWGAYNNYYFYDTNRYRHRSHIYMFGGQTNQPITLTNVSQRVSVNLHTGGRTDAWEWWRDNDPRLSYTLIVDGVSYTMANFTTDNDNYYRWWFWGYGSDYDSIVTSYLFTNLTPGTHTYNIKVSFISDHHDAVFESATTSHVHIEEEPSSATYTPPNSFDQPFTRPAHYVSFYDRT